MEKAEEVHAHTMLHQKASRVSRVEVMDMDTVVEVVVVVVIVGITDRLIL